MGAPPKSLATHGRANPAGIPYLYLGSLSHAAVAEVRPHPGEFVCVAKFELQTEIQVVDEDDGEIALMRGDVEFLERLGKELTTPILPNSAAIDYIPNQYLCEFIKKCGYKGVLYSSSVSEGTNLALFDPQIAVAETVTEYTINKVNVEMSAKAK